MKNSTKIHKIEDNTNPYKSIDSSARVERKVMYTCIHDLYQITLQPG